MRPPLLCVVVAALLFTVLAGREASRDAVTVDEGVYVASGLAAIEHGALHLNPEHPPLARMLAALPLLAVDGAHAPVTPSAQAARWFDYTDDFWEAQREAGASDSVRRWARVVPILLSLVAAALLYVLGTRWFTPWAGTLAATSWLTTASVVALGHVATIDVPIVVATLGVVLAADRFLRQPSDRTALVLGAATAVALLTRHSAIVLVPAMIATIACSSGSARDRARRGALVLLVAWAGVWIFYRAVVPGGPPQTASAVLGGLAQGGGGILGRLVGSIPWPLEHRAGLGYLFSTDEPRPGYLLGEAWTGRQWWYWPVVLVVKLPPATLAAIVMAPLGAARLPEVPGRRFLVLSVVGATALAAVAPERTIGSRYLLPVVALGLVLGAGAIVTMKRRLLVGVAASALLASQVVLLVGAHPHSFAYVNPGWGDPYRVVTDSDLDWAQDVSRAETFAASLDEPVHGSLFRGRGTVGTSRIRPLVGASGDELVGWVLASASNLVAYQRDELAWMRGYCPVGNIGGSILVWRFRAPPAVGVPGPDRPVAPCESQEESQEESRRTG